MNTPKKTGTSRMRIVVQYLIPIASLILVLVLIFSNQKKTNKGDSPLVSGSVLIIVLAITGSIGVLTIVFALQAFGII